MKTEFEIDFPAIYRDKYVGRLLIIGKKPDNPPYVAIRIDNKKVIGFIHDKDLERFAVNILKALKSKRLKP